MGLTNFFTDKKTLSFLCGVATATVGVKALKSKTVRNATVRTIAEGLKLQEDAQAAFETLKEDAQDLYSEAKQDRSTKGPSTAK